MVADSACLPPEKLRGYLRNEVADATIQQIEDHLDQCAACCECLQAAVGQDAIAIALRGSPATHPPAVLSAAFKQLQQRLGQLRLAATIGTPGHGSTGIGAADRADAAVDLRGYLLPSENAADLGRLGGYRVSQVLGRGGMGVVLLAHDDSLKRPVALKLMLPSLAASARNKERFQREAQAMARVSHQHVVRVYQVGEANGLPFLAMEYLEGESLDQWLTKKKRSLAEILRIALGIAEGLAAAHAQGLVHRDIKPSNVWLEGANRVVKLLDFGLARAEEGEKLTDTGAMVGTPAYMSPEQADGKQLDGRADLFSLGCVLYQMCSNRLPFPGETPMQILASMIRHTPTPLQQLNPQLPEGLARLIQQLLEKERTNRPANARTVVEQLRKLERGRSRMKGGNVPDTHKTVAPPRPATMVQPPNELLPLPKNVPVAAAKRRRVWWWAGVAAVVLAGGVTSAVLLQDKDPVTTRELSPTVEQAAVITADPKIESAKAKPLFETSNVTNPKLFPGIRTWGIVTRHHRGNVQAVATNSQGTTIAVASDDGLVRLWDAKTKQLQKVLAPPTGKPLMLAFAPNGKYLSVTTRDVGTGDTLTVWNVESGKRLRTLLGHQTFGVWNPDGKTFIYAKDGEGKELIIIDLAKWTETKMEASTVGRTPTVYASMPHDISASGKRLVTATNPVRIIDLETRREILVLDKQEMVGLVKYSPVDGGGFLVLGRPTARLIEGREEYPLDIKEAKQTPSGGVFTPDGKRLILWIFNPAYIGHYNVETKKMEKTAPCELSYLTSLHWLADGKTLVGYRHSDDSTVFFLDYAGKVVGSIPAYEPLKHGKLWISPDGHYDGSKGIEKELVYVVETDAGQETYSPEEFATKFRWQNDPKKVLTP